MMKSQNLFLKNTKKLMGYSRNLFLKNSKKVDDRPTDRPTDVQDLRIYATSRRIKNSDQNVVESRSSRIKIR